MIPGVCQSVSLCGGFTRLRCANTAERIEVLLGVKILDNHRNTALSGSHYIPQEIEAQPPVSHRGPLFILYQCSYCRQTAVHQAATATATWLSGCLSRSFSQLNGGVWQIRSYKPSGGMSATAELLSG